MYKFLVFLLITLALLTAFVEAKHSGLVRLPTKIDSNYYGAIYMFYKGKDILIY